MILGLNSAFGGGVVGHNSANPVVALSREMAKIASASAREGKKSTHVPDGNGSKHARTRTHTHTCSAGPCRIMQNLTWQPICCIVP